MSCPSEAYLLATELGELEPPEAQQVRQHASSCADCQAVLRQHRDLLEELCRSPIDNAQAGGDSAEFVERVIVACRLSDDGPASKPHPRPLAKRALVGVGLVLVAAMGVLLARGLIGPSRVQDSLEWIASRGNHHESTPAVEVEVSVVRNRGLLPAEGATLRPGDGIAVRYRNALLQPTFLAVFAIDVASTVHWIHPAYLDANTDPTSIPLVNTSESRLLDEIVEPEHPANGPMRIVAVVSSEPLRVRDVEATIARGGAVAEDWFPSSSVKQWSCRWSE